MQLVNVVGTAPRHAVTAFRRYETAHENVDLPVDRGLLVEHVILVARDPSSSSRSRAVSTLCGPSAGRDVWRALMGLLFGWPLARFLVLRTQRNVAARDPPVLAGGRRRDRAMFGRDHRFRRSGQWDVTSVSTIRVLYTPDEISATVRRNLADR